MSLRSCLGLPLLVYAGLVGAEPGAELLHCRGIADDAARLGCYDALATPSAAAAAAPAIKTAPPVAAVQQAIPAATPPAAYDFGAESIQRKAAPIPETAEQSLEAKVVGHVETLRKGARYKLDNGQLWLNIDEREVLVDADDPAVTIERNFLGNYRMTFETRGAAVKVRRIQ
jgi:hypothetical protein